MMHKYFTPQKNVWANKCSDELVDTQVTSDNN